MRAAHRQWGVDTRAERISGDFSLTPHFSLSAVLRINYPAELFVVEAEARVKMLTEGLSSCHAVALCARDSYGSGIMYLLHNLAHRVAVTRTRLEIARRHIADHGGTVMHAVCLAPTDEIVREQGFAHSERFSPQLPGLSSAAGVQIEPILYTTSEPYSGIAVQFEPHAKSPFSVQVYKHL